MAKNSKRRAWKSEDVRTLKTLAKKKTRAASIARTLKRTEGAPGEALVWGRRSIHAAEGNRATRIDPALGIAPPTGTRLTAERRGF
jgi:hypothetical protein